jgi:hypothetical protein
MKRIGIALALLCTATPAMAEHLILTCQMQTSTTTYNNGNTSTLTERENVRPDYVGVDIDDRTVSTTMLFDSSSLRVAEAGEAIIRITSPGNYAAEINRVTGVMTVSHGYQGASTTTTYACKPARPKL